jgi:hypothetical protein
VAIKSVEPGGQADGTVCEAGQIITHVNGIDVRDMTSKQASPLFRASDQVVFTLAPAGSYTGPSPNSIEVTLVSSATTRLGIILMKNKDHSEGKGVAIKSVEPGGQADGTVCEAGQIITHVNGIDVRDMTSKQASPLFRASDQVVFTLAPAGSYTGDHTYEELHQECESQYEEPSEVQARLYDRGQVPGAACHAVASSHLPPPIQQLYGALKTDADHDFDKERRAAAVARRHSIAGACGKESTYGTSATAGLEHDINADMVAIALRFVVGLGADGLIDEGDETMIIAKLTSDTGGAFAATVAAYAKALPQDAANSSARGRASRILTELAGDADGLIESDSDEDCAF